VECWIRFNHPDNFDDLELKRGFARGAVQGILCAEYCKGGEPLNIGLYESRPFFMFGFRGIMAAESILRQSCSSSQDPWSLLGFSERTHLAFVYEKEKSEMKIYINGKLNCSCLSKPLEDHICYLQVFSDNSCVFNS
jgi:hypothetical protein